MAAQTIWKNMPCEVQWIVVDDGYPKTKCTMNQLYVRGPVDWHDGYNTQRDNMNTAFSLIDKDADYIFIIEDDDYYAPMYLEQSVRYLEKVDLVGLYNVCYYHVGTPSYMHMMNCTHASLANTAFTKNCLELLYRAINSGNMYFDIHLWGLAIERNIKRHLYKEELAVGTKGLPGRGGIGYGHRNRDKFKDDPEYKYLEKMIGKANCDEYRKFKV